MKITLIVNLYGSFYKIWYITLEDLLLESDGDLIINQSRKRIQVFVTSALFLQPFINELKVSSNYRRNVIANLSQNRKTRNILVNLQLEPPDREIIDYLWNYRIQKLVWSRVESQNAFSWLSTLGGAYSALGDYFQDCADEAGRIALHQYKISKILGDESLAARSRLYAALSHSQKGNLKTARHIVRMVADFGRHTKDVRLIRMCQGVWAKLKYLRSLKKEKKLNEVVSKDSLISDYVVVS